MMSRIVSLFVALSILACPLLCGVSSAIAGSSQGHVCSCCHKCAPSDQSAPLPSSDDEFCQCICGGAVLELAVQVDLDDAGALITSLTPPTICQASLTADAVAVTVFAPSQGHNLGRALRTALRSFLC